MTELFRKLEISDYYKGFLELISQLTTTGSHSFEEFKLQYNKISTSDCYILVCEYEKKIIATGKLLIEAKFHNNFSNMGHIEDIVVEKNYRAKGIGKKIINLLTDYAFNNNCYKVTLDCNNNNIEFYQKCNFKLRGTQMTIYLDDYKNHSC